MSIVYPNIMLLKRFGSLLYILAERIPRPRVCISMGLTRIRPGRVHGEPEHVPIFFAPVRALIQRVRHCGGLAIGNRRIETGPDRAGPHVHSEDVMYIITTERAIAMNGRRLVWVCSVIANPCGRWCGLSRRTT